MKILIVKLSSLGDIVHSLPVLHLLREEYPNGEIDWLVGNKGYDFLKLMAGISNLYLFNVSTINKLKSKKYDYIIDLQGLFKTGLISKLIGGKDIIGFKNTREYADIFYNKKIDAGSLFNTNRHIVDLNLELVKELIVHKTLELNKIKFGIPKITVCENSHISGMLKKPSALVLPATTWASKMWPLNSFAELINELSHNYNVIVSALKSDTKYLEPLFEELFCMGVSVHNLVGKTSIIDLIYLIQNVNLVIGLDSGGLHIAAAVKNDYGAPHVIGIYGPTSIYRNGPYNSIQDVAYLKELNCLFCRKRTCPLGHHKCMNDLHPSFVMDKIKALSMV